MTAPAERRSDESARPTATATWRVLHTLFGPPARRPFAIRLWDGTSEAPAGEHPTFTLVFRHPGALRQMLLPLSELSLAEAYISGDVDIEGDIEGATQIGDLVAQHIGTPRMYLPLLPQILGLPKGRDVGSDIPPLRQARDFGRHGRLHAPERDAQAIQFHYNVGNDFYALWLDRRMVYSCAYFEPGVDDIDRAQEAKLDYICRKLRLSPGERFLDIGCGWGGLVQYAAERYGVQALGITLSEPQAAAARARIDAAGLSNRCRVELLDYRKIGLSSGPGRTFDKIASVGMVEHVGRQNLPTYFAAAYRALEPGGLFLNHGIVSLSDARPASVSDRITARLWRHGAFIERYVFPDGDLPPLATVIAAAERAGFETRDAESLREHYARTLRHWGRRLAQHAAEAQLLVGDATYRVWRLYMAASAHRFTSGGIGIVQTLLAKPDAQGRCTIPPTRHDLYARG